MLKNLPSRSVNVCYFTTLRPFFFFWNTLTMKKNFKSNFSFENAQKIWSFLKETKSANTIKMTDLNVFVTKQDLYCKSWLKLNRGLFYSAKLLTIFPKTRLCRIKAKNYLLKGKFYGFNKS